MKEQVVEAGPLTGMLLKLHLPTSVIYWPPAPLWWLIAVLLTALMCWRALAWYRKNRLQQFEPAIPQAAQSLAQTTQAHLQNLYAQWQQDTVGTIYLSQANVLLKRYVISHNSEPHLNNTLPTAWHGKAWVNWMQRSAPTCLTQKTTQALAEDCYRCEATLTPVPITEIHQQLLQWITDYDEQQHA